MSKISQILDGLQIQKSLILPFTPIPRSITTGNIFMQRTTGSLYVRDSNAETLVVGGGSVPQDPTYYISTTGSDSNLGTLGAPFATFRKAFETATMRGWMNTCSIRFLPGTFQIGDGTPLNYAVSGGTKTAPLTIYGSSTQVLSPVAGAGATFNPALVQTDINYTPGGLVPSALKGKFLHFLATSSAYFADTFHPITDNSATTIGVSSLFAQPVTAADSFEVVESTTQLITDQTFLLVTVDRPVLFRLLKIDSGSASFNATISLINFLACALSSTNPVSEGFNFSTSRIVFGNLIRLVQDPSNQMFADGSIFNSAIVNHEFSQLSLHCGSFATDSTMTFQASRVVILVLHSQDSAIVSESSTGILTLAGFIGQKPGQPQLFISGSASVNISQTAFSSTLGIALLSQNGKINVDSCSFDGFATGIFGTQSDAFIINSSFNACISPMFFERGSRISLDNVTGANAGSTALTLASGSNAVATTSVTVTGTNDYKVGGNAAQASPAWATLPGAPGTVTSDYGLASPQYCTLQSV
ncbi:hypothetical protein LAU_0025 [Lausannevirus]|uniref:Uncharacterized protein n=1 Tax=Lausannevirus TaxID=999883 RepID=F2WKV8_9VIRU|nr:hypothetical protein LAU_0025 [Lausannevirus]AEA06881.1 hypothetical protein LAU_0025 [Lausannevirus]